MAITVEDGTGLSNADSYASVAEADAYFDIIPGFSETWADLSINAKENWLKFSTRVLDARTNWEGTKYVETSALRWPRSGVVDRDGLSVDTGVVPTAVKHGTFELVRILEAEDVTTGQDIERLKFLKVDVLELEYQEGDSQSRIPDYIDYVLSGLGSFLSGGRMTFNKIRKA